MTCTLDHMMSWLLQVNHWILSAVHIQYPVADLKQPRHHLVERRFSEGDDSGHLCVFCAESCTESTYTLSCNNCFESYTISFTAKLALKGIRTCWHCITRFLGWTCRACRAKSYLQWPKLTKPMCLTYFTRAFQTNERVMKLKLYGLVSFG